MFPQRVTVANSVLAAIFRLKTLHALLCRQQTHIVDEIARELNTRKTCEARERDADVVELRALKIFSNQIGRKHQHVRFVCEALRCGQIADAFFVEAR